jgi:protein TonB
MRSGEPTPLRAVLGHCFRAVLLLAGAILFTLGYFIVLPLLGALGHPPEEQLELRSLDVIEDAPPPPPEVAPEENREEQAKPELNTDINPLDLSDLESALTATAGGDGAGFALDLGKYVRSMGAKTDGIFSMAELDQKPQATYQPAPTYPPELQRQRIGGTVTILFVVGAAGTVEDAKVESSPHPTLEREALAAVRKWRFDPGRRGGKPVPFRMRVPITFAPQ